MASLLWLSFITTSWSCLISFNFLWDTNNSFRVRYLCFKIPIALLHIFESKVLWLALHLVLRSLILSVSSRKWLVLAVRFAFLLIVFCLFSFHFLSFLLLPSKTTTENLNKICDAKLCPQVPSHAWTYKPFWRKHVNLYTKLMTS